MQQERRRALVPLRRHVRRRLVSLLVLVSLLAAFLHVHIAGAHAIAGPVSVAATADAGADGAACLLCAFVGGSVLAPALVVLALVLGCSFALLGATSRPSRHVLLDVWARGPPVLLIA